MEIKISGSKDLADVNKALKSQDNCKDLKNDRELVKIVIKASAYLGGGILCFFLIFFYYSILGFLAMAVGLLGLVLLERSIYVLLGMKTR